MDTQHQLEAPLAPEQLWMPSPALSPRVRRLREEYWSFYTRRFRNEVRAYTTGTPWDMVYSIWQWSNVPEVAPFQAGYRSYLPAGGEPVELPPSFWDEPLAVRQALFFREVVRCHLPVTILEGELVVGAAFATSASRCLKRAEARRRDREERKFLKEWDALNDVGVGNCGAVPGHLIPDYPKALRLGWRRVPAYGGAERHDPHASPEQRHLARAIVIC